MQNSPGIAFIWTRTCVCACACVRVCVCVCVVQICISVLLSGFYQQTDGCTLGGPLSVIFSNAYMLNLESNEDVVDPQNLLSINCFRKPNLRFGPFYCVW